MIINNTPIEEYNINDKIIYVKREDLCSKSPLPPFSKNRGIIKAIVNLNDKGYTVFGYTESAISMAGIAISAICKRLGLKSVIYDPQYSNNNKSEYLKILEHHRNQWKILDAEVIPIKAGMVKVNYYICKKLLSKSYENSIMLPIGLPLPETIEETAKEVQRTQNIEIFKTIVVCVGSGTICAGILKGYFGNVIGIMTRSGNISEKKKKILKKSDTLLSNNRLKLIDLGYTYTQKESIKCPFPSHPYYDRKAWKWLVDNINDIEHPILFWNIGR